MPSTPHEVEIQLRWGDMDPLNHINNVQFARILEEARVRTTTAWIPADAGPLSPVLVARQTIEYAAPLHYSIEPAIVRVWISRLGGSSFDFAFEILDSSGTLTAIAETVMVKVEMPAGTPQRIDDVARAVLSDHLGDRPPFR